MHTSIHRFYAVITYSFYPTVFLLFCIGYFSEYIKNPKINVNLKIYNYKPFDRTPAFVTFSPNIDLNSEFSINTRQIFLYLNAKYGDHDEIVWSKIVQKKDEKVFNKKFVNNYDFYGGMDVRFELRGCLFPYVGVVKEVLYDSVELKSNKV